MATGESAAAVCSRPAPATHCAQPAAAWLKSCGVPQHVTEQDGPVQPKGGGSASLGELHRCSMRRV